MARRRDPFDLDELPGLQELDALAGYEPPARRRSPRQPLPDAPSLRQMDAAREARTEAPAETDAPNVETPASARPTSRDAKRREELRRWIRTVGAARANAAWTTRDNIMRGRLGNKPTMIESLAESFLLERGVQYDAQVQLGFARPDLVVFNTRPDGLAVIWNINGDYWHANRTWHDYGKGSAAIQLRVNNVAIADVIDIWESDILRSNQVFEDALIGRRYRN